MVEAAGLRFEVPNTWTPTAPKSRMRAAQVTIPGEPGAAELAVFHFGEGGGGKVEDNLVRWIGQIEPPQGEQPKREFFEEGAFAVTMLSARGTLKAGRMGMGPTEAQPSSMLLAAVVEGPGGTVVLQGDRTGGDPGGAARYLRRGLEECRKGGLRRAKIPSSSFLPRTGRPEIPFKMGELGAKWVCTGGLPCLA